MYQKKANKKTSATLLVTLLVLNLSPLFSMLVYADEALIVGNVTSDTPSNAVETPTDQASSSTVTSTPGIVSSASSSDFNLQENTTTNFSLGTLSSTSTSSLNTTDVGATTTIFTLIDILHSLTASSSPTFISSGTTTDATTTPNVGTVASTSTTTVASLPVPTEVILEDASGTLPTGTTTITTGEAVAMANILNIVNTNLVNSTGSIVLANIPEGYDGTLDLRNSTSPLATSTCTLLACNGIDSISAKVTADADIENVIALHASSGSNLVATREHAVIGTGNTYAGLNLVNVANTNVIDSNYFLLSLNSFKNINGDIVLPSLSNFFSTMRSVSTNSTINMQAAADTVNNLSIRANAGENAIESVSGAIHTGSTISSTNISNTSNSSLVGGGSVSLLLKVSGAWVGELFGAPSGSAFAADGNVRTLNLGEVSEGRSVRPIQTDIMSTSTARISNTASILSDSGSNQTVDTTDSQITTGNAYAAANVINIANTNVVGRNWILAIINIFGDFNGNIAFGRPDLWLGEQVTTSPIVQNGSVLTYTVTLINKGDSDATEVNVSSIYDKAHLDILDATVPYTEDASGNLTFTLGTLAPHDAKEIVFHARIRDTAPGTAITNTLTAVEHEPDNNTADNQDTTTITTTTMTISGSGAGGTLPPSRVPITITPITVSPTYSGSGQVITVEVKRAATSTTLVGAGTVGEQVLTLHNLSGFPVHASTFDDVLYDPAGKKVRTETFDVGDLLPYEEVTVTYNLSFGIQPHPGVYMFSSELHYSTNHSLLYSGNGSVNYVRTGSGLGNGPDSSTTIGGSLGSEGFATTSLWGVTFAPTGSSSVRKLVQKGTFFGRFMESFLPQKAYADVIGEDTASAKNLSYSLLFLFFLIISSFHVYHRFIRLVIRQE